MAKYTVHGGHAAHGNKNCGAVGYCSESLVDRQIKDAVIKYLKLDGHLIKDCTVDSGLTASSIVTAIKKLINGEQNVTANTSIHLNAWDKTNKDGKTKGVECCVYSSTGTSADIGNRICQNIAKFGFTNRGNKVRTNLGVLKGIKNGGANVLVECFFCDDEDDYILYTKLGADTIGKAIAEGIVGHSIGGATPSTNKKETVYIPQPTLKKGCKGEQVLYLQTALNLICYAGLDADGSFGPKTVDALRKWQSAAGLKADGIYGPNSYNVMKKMILEK